MCLQEIKDEIIDAGKESVDIVNIGLHFFSQGCSTYAASCNES